MRLTKIELEMKARKAGDDPFSFIALNLKLRGIFLYKQKSPIYFKILDLPLIITTCTDDCHMHHICT